MNLIASKKNQIEVFGGSYDRILDLFVPELEELVCGVDFWCAHLNTIVTVVALFHGEEGDLPGRYKAGGCRSPVNCSGEACPVCPETRHTLGSAIEQERQPVTRQVGFYRSLVANNDPKDLLQMALLEQHGLSRVSCMTSKPCCRRFQSCIPSPNISRCKKTTRLLVSSSGFLRDAVRRKGSSHSEPSDMWRWILWVLVTKSGGSEVSLACSATNGMKGAVLLSLHLTTTSERTGSSNQSRIHFFMEKRGTGSLPAGAMLTTYSQKEGQKMTESRHGGRGAETLRERTHREPRLLEEAPCLRLQGFW